MIRLKSILLSTLFFVSFPLYSMVCDNQWFPLFPKPHSRTTEKPSWFVVDVFFTTADSAYDDKENEIPIPSLLGEYDQNKLGTALTLVGKENPMPDEFRGAKIPWSVCGKIQSQGIGFGYEQKLFHPVSVGFSWLLMHVHSRQEFSLKHGEAGFLIKEDGDVREIEDARRQMHKELGMCDAQSSITGMGDFDLFVRFGNIWDYELKCRTIDAGLSLGLLMPSGVSRDVNNAATVPFGGNGHWGMYLQADAECELKEDWKFGFFARLTKRFEKTFDARLTVAGEHPLFGALVAPVSVLPGVNFTFAPYFSMENLRQGLGIRVAYHLTLQQENCWADLRSRKNRENLPAEDKKLRKISGWASDYATLTAFYDFGKVEVESNHKPIVTLSWDIPFLLFVAKNVCKTHRVSLGLGVAF